MYEFPKKIGAQTVTSAFPKNGIAMDQTIVPTETIRTKKIVKWLTKVKQENQHLAMHAHFHSSNKQIPKTEEPGTRTQNTLYFTSSN